MDINALLEDLEKRGFDAQYFQDPKQVDQELAALVKPGTTAGYGGSSTLRELGVPNRMKTLGATNFDHWEEGLTDQEIDKIRLEQGRADIFFTSVNACTQDGRLVLVDGIGNRVSASIFGPKQVVHIFGVNKIVPDLHAAFDRIQNIAGPKRAASLNMKNPCVKTGKCQDCRSKTRICRATVILDFAPMLTPSKVWIVEGNFGY